MAFPIKALGVALFAVATFAEAQTFTQLYSFQRSTDGGNPFAGVIADSAGDVYGTTYAGGNLSTCTYPGCGVVYKVDTAGNETPLYTFGATSGDGSNPVAGLVADPTGDFFGSTAYGGPAGYGSVFEVNAAGYEKILHSFTGGADGGVPNGGVIRDRAGNLYGTTYTGGAAGLGTVYKVSVSGDFTTLYSIPDRAHGSNPNAGLLRDSDGNLYGTTQYGGASNRGTVFKLDSDGNFTVLYSFSRSPDGAYPQSPPVFDKAGNLYGTTTEGGASNNGTIFKLAPSGTESIVHNFAGGTDGSYPMAGVVLDAAGNLYGSTFNGGSFNAGTVFKIDTQGNETLLYTFQASFDGQSPVGQLLLAPNATAVYGVTESGGFAGAGAVYKVTLP